MVRKHKVSSHHDAPKSRSVFQQISSQQEKSNSQERFQPWFKSTNHNWVRLLFLKAINHILTFACLYS